MTLRFIEKMHAQTADACIIWLHGLGASGADLVDIIAELELPPHAIKFIFPHAPMQAVTLNGGMSMPAWYDITALNAHAPEDKVGLEKSRQALNALIQQQIAAGIAPHRILLVGFSQGGALALYTSLQHQPTLGGVVALSAYLPLHRQLEDWHLVKTIPVLMMHGMDDPVIPISAAYYSKELLMLAGLSVEWHTYPMAHTVCQEELVTLTHWIKTQLAL